MINGFAAEPESDGMKKAPLQGSIARFKSHFHKRTDCNSLSRLAFLLMPETETPGLETIGERKRALIKPTRRDD